MSDVVVAGLLVSASVFLVGVLCLPGNILFSGTAWPVGRLAQGSLGEAEKAEIWLFGWHKPAAKEAPFNVEPLQMVAGALGLLGGLALSMAFPLPIGRWLFPLVCGISSYQIPALLMKRKLAAQSRNVLRELPEVVSLLRTFPHRNLAAALAATSRVRHGPLAAVIREALERNATGVLLLKAMSEATAGLKIAEVGRFVDVLAQVERASTSSHELLRTYEHELLLRRRVAALRQVETAEGKISAVLTVATAMQLLLLLVVPSLLQFFGPGLASL